MNFLIYIISFLEGFTTLSIEIVALRNFTPIIGTNSISTSVILGVILLALSYGYFIGGKISRNLKSSKIKKKVVFNLSIAGLYYLFFTFLFDQYILNYLLENSGSYFLSILFTSIFLFFIPVFLSSQTIPLLSEILKGDNIGEKIGKLLFFSTIGSFLGSVSTSMIFFPNIGVEKTAVLNSFILGISAFSLAMFTFKKIYFSILISFFVSMFSFFSLLEINYSSEYTIYKGSNSYHNIEIIENNNKQRIFLQNNGYASGIDIETGYSFFEYIKEIKNQIINGSYENILIIGAAGFTLPSELSEYDFIKNIDVVDVDGSLKDISETYFLQKKLSDKINFINEPSRYFIKKNISNNNKYDAIVIDVYVGKSLAPQTLTYEFFSQISNLTDYVYINIITDKKLESDFSKKLLTTMQTAFGNIYIKDVDQTSNNTGKSNFVISNIISPGYNKYLNLMGDNIYYDDKNSIELDLIKQKN